MIRENYQLVLLIISIFLVGCNQSNPKDDRSILSGERFPAPTALTVADIKWFRNFGVSWIFSENGAPTLLLPNMTLEEQAKLYGNSNDDARLAIDRFERVFTTFAVYGSLIPGVYSIDTKKVVGELPESLATKTEFELTQTHVTLMRKAWWRGVH